MIKIEDIKIGQAVEFYAMVSVLIEKIATNNKPYVEINLKDKTGEVSGKLWETNLADININIGDLVYVQAKSEEWNGRLQLKQISIRQTTAEDNISRDDFLEVAPIAPNIMLDYVYNIIEDIKNSELRLLTKTIVKNYECQLIYYPAAKSVHHNIKSGLLYHIFNMLMSAVNQAEIYNNINRDLLYSGVILHDIGKIEEMESNTDGIVNTYTTEGKLLGHIIQGIKIVDKYANNLNISNNITLCIEHMIASHHGQEEWGAVKKPMFLEAEILHHLDMIDSKIYIFTNVTNNIDDNTFTDYQRHLDNRQIYNPKL